MSSYNFRFRQFKLLPEIIKNLIIINGLFFLGTFVIRNTFGIDLTRYLGLYFPASEQFHPIQIITHMFMHDQNNFMHIFMNMFMLWMFGSQLENMWGGKRFLIYYFITGFGAVALHILINSFEYFYYISKLSDTSILNTISNSGADYLFGGQNYTNELLAKINILVNVPTVGASGAVYGVLMAYGMSFPNNIVYLYFAIPVKVKYFVMGLIAIELISGLSIANSNIAHFAHLGGMLFGYFLIRYWRKNNRFF